MMSYEDRACPERGAHLLIYHQYQGDARCEGCGEWEEDSLAERQRLIAEGERQQARASFYDD